MKKTVILITIILTLYQVLQAQTLEKRIIDKKLELKEDAVYVVNGLPYEQKDSLKLNSVLKSFSLNHLVDLIKHFIFWHLITLSKTKQIAVDLSLA